MVQEFCVICPFRGNENDVESPSFVSCLFCVNDFYARHLENPYEKEPKVKTNED